MRCPPHAVVTREVTGFTQVSRRLVDRVSDIEATTCADPLGEGRDPGGPDALGGRPPEDVGSGRIGGAHVRTMRSCADADHAAEPGVEPAVDCPEERPVSPEPTDERNVLGGRLEPCGTDPVTGFYRDGHCSSGPDDVGRHTVCTVVSADFLALQQDLGNDLSTPRPEYGFPGLKPGDRWCVVAVRWFQAYQAGAAAGVVLAATNARTLEVVPIEALRQHAVDVPDDPSSLE